ncbi:HET-domain-containing protein [Aspergillus eucalypticola CBS 122712]|uniref:HET-domain-containing protein n=1 Tax=Aspergillus eucalypticola (strain CBS 122712 / IBT 29274) TaxID=1448314 RepID=A0A317VGQ4_ASPEC|nr:HET-domain-containing protein [Aspergillus eucalypticola CBS 122712]PWY73546.1 HET-domain-containing protein [Aspergillus eucalypticola CBS 122712]
MAEIAEVTDSLTLDRPCTYCRVLKLDDIQHGGRIEVAADGKAYVDFGTEVMTVENKIAEVGPTAVAAARALSYVNPEWFARFVDPEVVLRTTLKLDFKRTDVLPSLSGITMTASGGCSFCHVLRQDLLTIWGDIALKEGTQPAEAELIITEVWLDTLYVFFTINQQQGVTEYSSHYNLYTDADDPCASWFSLGRQPVGNNPMSPASLGRLQQLIALSVQETPLETDDSGEFLPTRLLDLSSRGCSALRLVLPTVNPEFLSLKPSQRRYATLSYSWGSIDQAKRQLKTVSDTHVEHLSSIKLGKIPQTIADAIQLCRALGIRFLWVDALCIIQDDKEDWAKEALSMSQVYSHSFITLCILRGDSCSSGFLKPKHNPLTVTVLEDCELVQTSVDLPGEFGLAPQIVFFGDSMFHMISGTLRKSADHSGFEHETYFERKDSLRETLCSWYQLAQLYSKKLLTYEQDRLPAIAALARIINERFPEQRYLAGLWESDLHRGLLWTTVSFKKFDDYHKLQSTNGYTAPSWSWACRPVVLDWVKGPTNPTVSISSEVTLQKADVKSEKFNPYGRVSQNGNPRVQNNGPRKFLGITFSYTLWSETDEYIANLHLDWDYNSGGADADGNAQGPLAEMAMLLIASTSLDQHSIFPSYDITSQEVMLGILVRPVAGTEGDYERLGLWYTEDRGLGGTKFWKNIAVQDIALV